MFCRETEVTPVPRPAEVPADLAPEIDAMFCTYPPVNLHEMRKLRFVQISSAGYSQLFGLNLPGRGIRASNARGCFDVPIAEWNVAMIVNLARDLRQMIRNQDSQVWDRGPRFQSEVRGSVVGLWGYGGIGRETARLLRAMGLRIHVLSRGGIGPVENVYAVPGTGDPDGIFPDKVFLAGEELAFLGGLNFLILAMPLTPTTEGIVGERELRALPRSAFVLNPSRGPLIQENALLQALTEGSDCGRRNRHALSLSAAAGAPTMAVSQRDPYTAHLGIGTKPVLSGSDVGDFPRERTPVISGTAAIERVVAGAVVRRLARFV